MWIQSALYQYYTIPQRLRENTVKMTGKYRKDDGKIPQTFSDIFLEGDIMT